MKQILLLLLAFLSCYGISAQPFQRTYAYDAAGNRISRSAVVLRSSGQDADPFTKQIEKDGISNSLINCQVTVYPNPTDGEVTISIAGGDENANSEITVYSNSGKLLEKLKAKGNTSVPVDLSFYPNGLYLIDFQQGENRSYYKIIKQ